MGIATAAAIAGSALVGAAASRKAGKVQERAAKDAAEERRQALARQEELSRPFRETGLEAQNALARLSGIGPDTGAADYGLFGRQFGEQDLAMDPGFGFRFFDFWLRLEKLFFVWTFNFDLFCPWLRWLSWVLFEALSWFERQFESWELPWLVFELKLLLLFVPFSFRWKNRHSWNLQVFCCSELLQAFGWNDLHFPSQPFGSVEVLPCFLNLLQIVGWSNLQSLLLVQWPLA